MIQEVGSQELVLNEPAEAAAPPVEGTLEGRLHATNLIGKVTAAVQSLQAQRLLLADDAAAYIADATHKAPHVLPSPSKEQVGE